MHKIKIMIVVGARPNFMKAAPLLEELSRRPGVEPCLVDTGQHYDHEMSRLFFDELRMPRPDRYLGIGSGTPAEQVGRTMIEFEKVLLELKPDAVVVVGDVNATIACAFVAVRHGVKLAHVEAGLRSFDRTMPEEVNRVLTDQIADLLFVTETEASENLAREGVPPERVFFTGNVMIDTLHRQKERAAQSDILARLSLSPEGYGVITLHRPSNVDEREGLTEVMTALERMQENIPLVFPVHPRTRRQIARFEMEGRLQAMKRLILLPPIGYLDFLKLMMHARFVVTDSGGIQEETTVLGIPCITMRENTERPVTVRVGTNEVVGRSAGAVVDAADRVLAGQWKTGSTPERWDGSAANRIADILIQRVQ